MDISVVVTVGNDEIVAHHAMKSLFKAIDYAGESGITSEILIVLDTVSLETKQYFSRYENNEICKIFNVDFLDNWESKNFGADNAVGKYVTFLEAKDLFSENWLAEAFKVSESSSEKIIAHPMYEVHFDKDMDIVKCENRKKRINFKLLSGNIFTSGYFAEKEVFTKHRFISSNKYFDPDWSFNCGTAKYKHCSVDRTVVFVRELKKKSSFVDKLKYDLDGHLCHPIDFPVKCLWRYGCYKLFKLFAFLKYINGFMHRHRYIWYQKFLNGVYFRPGNLKKPKWLMQTIIDINRIEPIIQSWKYKHILCSYDKGCFLESFCLAKLLNLYDKDTTCCIFMPFIGIGGAEKVACRYIDELQNTHSHITVFTTDKNPNATKRVLPTNIKVIHLDELFDNLSNHQKVKIIASLMIHHRPTMIYFYNSYSFFETLAAYGDEISRYSKIYLNVFALSFTKDTKEMLWCNVDYLSKTIPHLSKIITDNRGLINELAELYGISKEKFICNYSYTDLHDNVPELRDGTFNVFWASRIHREKRLDLLWEIVKKCENLPIFFHIFGIGKDNYLNKLKKNRNVKYYGGFTEFANIVRPDFDLFLYTSESDGIPNVLLEVMSYGYSVIAPNVGGISEVINEENGFLVENYLDTDRYVEILKELLTNKEVLKDKQKYIKESIARKFNKENFVETMRQIGMIE
ncbi:MAG: glycosyltransferase [Holosporaceae bacterium]|jgi:glycosyltransferase involved in cell wall biosynthesis|nr:glycosyltransferase [Holosporaceae bacterium]